MEEVNYDEMQIKILLYNGYEELLEKVILLRDVYLTGMLHVLG